MCPKIFITSKKCPKWVQNFGHILDTIRKQNYFFSIMSKMCPLMLLTLGKFLIHMEKIMTPLGHTLDTYLTHFKHMLSHKNWIQTQGESLPLSWTRTFCYRYMISADAPWMDRDRRSRNREDQSSSLSIIVHTFPRNMTFLPGSRQSQHIDLPPSPVFDRSGILVLLQEQEHAPTLVRASAGAPV